MASGALLILGMHRSGTSSLAGSLEQCGLQLGDVSHFNPSNRKGNREHPDVMSLNDRVLASSGGSWDNPPERIEWDDSLILQRDELIGKLRKASSGLWGFKDPRTLLTIPFWLSGMKDCWLVGTVRHPLAVANSMEVRGGMPRPKGLFLWRTYNQRMLEIWDQTPFPIVSFDESTEEYQRSVRLLAKQFGLSTPVEGQPFFDDSMRHQLPAGMDGELTQSDWLMYQRLHSIYRSWRDRAERTP
jgi:hypothetical protein